MSSWEEITAGAPQGSAISRLLLSIFVDNLFLHADDNSLYATGDCFEVIIEKFSTDLISFQSWIHEN